MRIYTSSGTDMLDLDTKHQPFTRRPADIRGERQSNDRLGFRYLQRSSDAEAYVSNERARAIRQQHTGAPDH
jgi:hypothetical protein